MNNKIRIIAFLLIAFYLKQTIIKANDDKLSVVWQYTYANPTGYSNGQIFSITNQSDGTYMASGSIIRNIDGRKLGYIIHFDESGEKLKHFIIEPSTISKEWNGNWWGAVANAPTAYLRNVYLLNSGEVIGIGGVQPNLYSYSSIPSDIRATYTYGGNQPGFKNGHWVTKFDYQTEAFSVNRLDKGMGALGTQLSLGPSNCIQFEDNKIVSIDFLDINLNSSNLNSIIRVYDYDLNILATSEQDQYWPIELVKTSDEEFELIGRSAIYNYKLNNNSGNYSIAKQGTTFLPLTNSEGCLGANGAGNIASIIKKKTDGYWVSTRLDMFNGNDSGNALYKKRNNVSEVVCKVNGNKSSNKMKSYKPPLQLSGGYNYAGNLIDCSNFPAVKYRMFIVEDDPNDPVMGDFVITDGLELPYTTLIMSVSSHDGVFSGGTNTLSGGNTEAAIAKLSTCLNLKVTSLPQNLLILKPYNPTIKVNIPIEYIGAEGSVTYYLKGVVKDGVVDGYSTGDIIEEISGPVETNVNGTGLAFSFDRTYNLSTEYATIEYTLYIEDSYTIAGVAQTCGQSYIFKVVTAPQTDIVALPRIKKEESNVQILATMKNSGQAKFINYKITIYDTAVGNSTFETYTYPQSINIGETISLNIDLPSTFNGVSNIAIRFNDNGTGSQNQKEISNRQFTYELEL